MRNLYELFSETEIECIWFWIGPSIDTKQNFMKNCEESGISVSNFYPGNAVSLHRDGELRHVSIMVVFQFLDDTSTVIIIQGVKRSIFPILGKQIQHLQCICLTDGHFAYGTNDKYLSALLFVLKEAVHDQYDYISWWLYEGAEEYMIWGADNSRSWCLREPEALYDYIMEECQ